MARDSLERLVGLLNRVGKQEVRRYCRDLVITSEDLSDLILAARIAGIGPYKYANHFAELRHESIEPTPGDLHALASNGVGLATGRALKAIHKMDHLFQQRRIIGVHLLYMRSQKYWHMFHFDQRDFAAHNNHWKHGPHIHYSQDTFVRAPLGKVWSAVLAANPAFPPAVHIRYDYHHNRPKAPNPSLNRTVSGGRPSAPAGTAG